MSFDRNTLHLHVYATALQGQDRRPLEMVQGLERIFPGLRLTWTVSEEMQLVQLPLRDTWLAQVKKEGGGFPLVCNNDESYPVMISGLSSSATSGPGGNALLHVHAQLPLDSAVTAVVADMLESVAESGHAYWGHATPFNASVDIARQTVDPDNMPRVPPRGLPALRLSNKIRSPEIPHRLGWLNYWSAAAAQAIDFPNPARDADLISRARRTASGGWVVQLTDVPLDLDNPAHLDALKIGRASCRERVCLYV